MAVTDFAQILLGQTIDDLLKYVIDLLCRNLQAIRLCSLLILLGQNIAAVNMSILGG